MDKLKRFFLFCWSNLIIRNLVFILLVLLVLVVGIMIWLNIFTRHDQVIHTPDLRGLRVEQVIPVLTNSNLRYQIVDSVYSEDIAPGAVIDQIPKANSSVKEGRIVFLTINAFGQKMLVLPDVEEMSQRQAVAMLQALGFEIELRPVPHPYVDEVVAVRWHGGRIFSGDKLPYGSSLIIEVGNGSELTDTLGVSTEIDSVTHEWFE